MDAKKYDALRSKLDEIGEYQRRQNDVKNFLVAVAERTEPRRDEFRVYTSNNSPADFDGIGPGLEMRFDPDDPMALVLKQFLNSYLETLQTKIESATREFEAID